MKSNYSSSLYYNTLAKKEREDLGEIPDYPDFNIMEDYAFMGSNTKAEKLLEKIKPTVFDVSKKNGSASVGMVAQCYDVMNESDSAIKYGLLALDVDQVRTEAKRWLFPYVVLGKAYFKKKEYRKSINFIFSGLKYTLAKKFQKDIQQAYVCVANDYFGLRIMDSSIYYARLSYDLGRKSSFNEVILNSSQLLFKIYNEQNKFDSSFKYLQISSALKDTLTIQNRVNDIDNITLNESIREQENGDQEKQKNRLIIGFSFFFIISFSGYTFYNRYKQKENIRRIEEDRKNKELKAAQDLQISMLPKQLPQRADLDIATFMRSSTEVGGDYYDFFAQPDGSLFTVCGDATGHGVASGMMVSVTKAALNGMSAVKPNKILKRLNAVVKRIDLGILRMSLNVVEFGTDEIALSSAAMPPIYLYTAKDGQVKEFMNNGLPLGGLRDEDFVLETRKFEVGDVLVQLSDGLPEAPNAAGELYDYDRLKNLIQSSCHLSAQAIIDILIKSVDEWMQGQPNPDDITLVVTKKK
jgi:sigma-B regulation protein RsbU (phosphoserine phosphatase)